MSFKPEENYKEDVLKKRQNCFKKFRSDNFDIEGRVLDDQLTLMNTK